MSNRHDQNDDGSDKVLLTVGTRPEIIKIAPVIRSLQESDVLQPLLLHTGQHYDDELSDAFFNALDLPPPDVHIDIGSNSHSRQTADGIVSIAEAVRNRTPVAVLAQGDTNAVLSTAVAVSKLPLPFGHIEAGIRSFDRSMPEETNRIIADHVADIAFAPTKIAVQNLATEGVVEDVYLTGNTIVDACQRYADVAARESQILDRLEAPHDAYAVATIHRPRNTDDEDRLRRIVEALDGMTFPVFLPAHPRTKTVLKESSFASSGSLRVIEPLDYLDFLQLLRGARVVVTDSGGIQEEAAVFEIPCLTVRPNTERPETVEVGVNELISPDQLEQALAEVFAADTDAMTDSSDLYGDGTAGEQIVDILIDEIPSRTHS